MSVPSLLPTLLTTTALVSQLMMGHCWQQDGLHALFETYQESNQPVMAEAHQCHHQHGETLSQPADNQQPVPRHHHCPHSNGEHDCACDSNNSYLVAPATSAPVSIDCADATFPALPGTLLTEAVSLEQTATIVPNESIRALPLRAVLQTWRL